MGGQQSHAYDADPTESVKDSFLGDLGDLFIRRAREATP
jgi:hypothetical protein